MLYEFLLQRLAVGLVLDAEPLESGACERLQRRGLGGFGYLYPSGLPISSISDVDLLDFLQADGACERLHRFVELSAAPSRGWISSFLQGAAGLTEGCNSDKESG